MSYHAARSIHAPLSAGQEAFGRIDSPTTGLAPTSGHLWLTFWRARKSETATKTRLLTGNTAAAGVTLARVGLYTVDASGNLTLVASSANDTTLFAATFTKYTATWSAGYGVTLGTRYATGVLVVATTMPTFNGQNVATTDEGQQAPPQCARLSGQSDLPATVSGAGLVSASGAIYSVTAP